MKGTGLFICLFYLFTSPLFASVCDDEESLLDNVHTSYSCVDEEKNQSYCIKIGYHDGVEKNSLIIKKLGEESFMNVFYHEPSYLSAGCTFYNPFKGCSHDTLRNSSKRIKAYSLRASDIVNKHSTEEKVTLNKKTGKGSYVKTKYKSALLGRNIIEEEVLKLTCELAR